MVEVKQDNTEEIEVADYFVVALKMLEFEKKENEFGFPNSLSH